MHEGGGLLRSWLSAREVKESYSHHRLEAQEAGGRTGIWANKGQVLGGGGRVS